MKAAAVICVIFAVVFEVGHCASLSMSKNRDTVTENVNPASDCQTCEYIMKFIQFQTLTQTQSVDDVKEKLKALFKIIPFSVQNEEYLSKVDDYVKMLQNGMDAKGICSFISKCSKEQREDLPSITKCEVCTAVVDLIKFELTVSNATLQVIIKAVQGLCAILGDVPVYEECKFVLKEINQIIQWIEQKLTPEDICVKLGFCNSTIVMIDSTSASASSVQLLSGETLLCKMCGKFIERIEDMLDDLDDKLDDVEDELNNICSALGDYAPQCKSTVNRILDEIKRNLKYMESKLDPLTTCKALTLCPSSFNSV